MKKYKIKFWIFYIKNIFCSRFVKYQRYLIYKDARRSGNTTRLIDKFIQDFFVNDCVSIYDHYGTRKASERTFLLVLDRLRREHNITDANLDVRIYYDSLTIKRIKK